MRFIGIDFGTSNSLASLAVNGEARFAHYPDGSTSNPTVLYFPDKSKQFYIGNDGIDRYLHHLEENEPAGRLMLSIKSLLPDAKFDYTTVAGHGRQAPEDLVSKFIIKLRALTEKEFDTTFEGVVLGRPVDFPDLAVQRLEWAARMAGFKEIVFWFEPVAAAMAYEMTTSREEMVCVVDIGGGTTDVCVIETSPARTNSAERLDDIKAVSGVYQAGDEMNSLVMKTSISERFGAGSTFKSMGKELPFPAHIIHKLSRWHRINLLRASGEIETILAILRTSDRPEDVERLYELVKHHYGFELFRAIDSAKRALSAFDSAEIRFRPLNLAEKITVDEFESAINGVADAIESSIRDCLTSASASPEKIDRVILTGGSSQVPALDRLVKRIFGEDKILRPDFFASVATGLGHVASRQN